jgi:regulatory protein
VPRADDRDPPPRALALGYRYLNRRDRTVFEMRRHLEQRGCLGDEIDGAIEVLVEQGYLDDGRYARLFAEDKRTLEQWGTERIQRTLLERGVDRELVDRTLAARAPDSEVARAVALLQRRFPTPLRGARDCERALGVLLRKGYDTEVAFAALTVHGDCADSSPVLRCR